MTDRIDLTGIEVWARHGVLPEEKTRDQPFVVDVGVFLDTAQAAASDDLEDTVDYGDSGPRRSLTWWPARVTTSSRPLPTGSQRRVLGGLPGREGHRHRPQTAGPDHGRSSGTCR